MFDVVWYPAEKRDEALKLVNRLPREEIDRRGLDYHLGGLRFCFDGAPTPNLDGTHSGKYGTCVMTNRLGTAGLRPGAVASEAGRLLVEIAQYVNIVLCEAGIVAGDWKYNFWSSPVIEKQISDQDFVEKNGKEAVERDQRERFFSECVNAAVAISRFVEMQKRLGGMGFLSRLFPWKVIRALKAEGATVNFEGVEAWLSRFSDEPKIDPYADTDPETYARSARAAIPSRMNR